MVLEYNMGLITAITPAGPHDKSTTEEARPTSLIPLLALSAGLLKSNIMSIKIDRSSTVSSNKKGYVQDIGEPSKGSLGLGGACESQV